MSHKRKYLLDSGPLVALFNESDLLHKKCTEFFGDFVFEYVTTEAVVSEVVHMIQKSKTPAAATKTVQRFMDDLIAETYKIHFLEKHHFKRIRDLRTKFSDQRDLDYADMTLVMAAEDLNIGEIITIDLKEFQKLRWKNKRPFIIIEPDLKKLYET